MSDATDPCNPPNSTECWQNLPREERIRESTLVKVPVKYLESLKNAWEFQERISPTNNYVALPLEDLEWLLELNELRKRKADALDLLLERCKRRRYEQGAVRIAAYDIFNDLELGPYISKVEIDSLEEIEALEEK